MSYLHNILEEIAKETGKSADEISKFELILQANWYDTQQTLSEATLEDLQTLKIPKVLAKKIIDKANGNSHQNLQLNKESNKSRQELNPYSEYERKLISIFKEYVSETEKLESLNILYKVLKNILSSPQTEKFRKLNLNNGVLHLALFRYINIVEYLRLVGFKDVQDGTFVSQKFDEGVFKYSCDLIEGEIVKTKTTSKKFDPFVASFSSNNPKFNVDMLKQVSDFQESSFDQKLRKLQETRAQLERNHTCVPTIKEVFVETSQNPTTDPSDDIKDAPNEEFFMFRQAIIDFQKNFMGDANFQSAKKKEFEKLSKEALDLDTVIRLKLPHGIFDIKLAAKTILADLFSLIKKNFNLSDNSFCLVAFMNRYSENSACINSTLRELNLVPNARMELLLLEPKIYFQTHA